VTLIQWTSLRVILDVAAGPFGPFCGLPFAVFVGTHRAIGIREGFHHDMGAHERFDGEFLLHRGSRRVLHVEGICGAPSPQSSVTFPVADAGLVGALFGERSVAGRLSVMANRRAKAGEAD
jgi:hypothetical protein